MSVLQVQLVPRPAGPVERVERRAAVAGRTGHEPPRPGHEVVDPGVGPHGLDLIPDADGGQEQAVHGVVAEGREVGGRDLAVERGEDVVGVRGEGRQVVRTALGGLYRGSPRGSEGLGAEEEAVEQTFVLSSSLFRFAR